MREEAFDGFLIRGKFTDDSTEADWWFYKNGDNTEDNKVSLADYVDPLTKEFEYRQEEKPTTLQNLFVSNTAIERIESIQGVVNLTSVKDCFSECSRLTDVRNLNIDTSLVTSFRGIFYYTAISELDISNLDTSKGRDFQYIFTGVKNLVSLRLNFDLVNGAMFTNMFTNCYGLKNVIGSIQNLKYSLSLKDSPLTAESAQVFIDGLYPERAGQTITFSATTKALLSDEQKAQIADKGWILG